jgi:class 3 adenylate cyclase
MRLRAEESTSEPRFDTQTAGKIAALATRLQQKHEESLTAREIEEIGAEVGLKPGFIQQALCYCQEKSQASVKQLSALPKKTLEGLAAAWWAAGWTLPLILLLFLEQLFDNALPIIGFFLGLATYIGGGIMLSYMADAEAQPASGKLPRAQLLEMLFALQHELDGQKQHRAFLSVDVVDSSEMKRNAPDLAVEYSFRQFHQWVEGIVRAEGGDLQSAAGDGVMCVFPTNGAALRAARQLQERIEPFNAACNRLPIAFRIRCGASAGAVAIEEGLPLGHLQSTVIDRAAALQKRAAPGDITVSSELADAALQELGTLSRLPEPINGEPAFSWRRSLPGA